MKKSKTGYLVFLKRLTGTHFFKVMRVTVFLILIGINSVFASSTYSQATKFTFNLNDISLEQLFEEIQSQSEFNIFYKNSQVDKNRKVDITASESSVEDILTEALKGTQLDFKVIDRQIVIFPKKNIPEEIKESDIEQPQQKQISGTVTDEAGQPLPGVTIIVKGTTIGTVTDVNGQFTFEIPIDAETLQVSFVGMKTQELTIGNNTVFNVVMEEETVGLEEVVAVGYGVQKKATLTGSIGTVKSEELVQRPAANSTELLQGEVAGLITRQESGLPGEDGTTLRVRGFNAAPLIMVDGIETPLAHVDPNDIESISVLKDAAAAVYGARAGNGVILVTTKRGADGVAKISYHGSVSVAQPTFLPQMVNASKWGELMKESGVDPEDYAPEYLAWDTENHIWTSELDGSRYYGNNWGDAMYRNWTPQHQHNLSASGGTKKIKYFVSMGYTSQKSIFNSGDYDFDRYNIRSNIDAEITKGLSLAVDFAYRTTVLDKANFDVTEMYNYLQRAKPVYPYVHEADPTKATYGGPYYQTFEDYSGFIKNKNNVITGGLELKYKFPMIKGLTAKVRLNYEQSFAWDKNVSKPFETYDYDPVAASNGEDPWTVMGTGNIKNIIVSSDRSTELLPMFNLEYIKSIGDHHFTGMIVGEINTLKYTYLEGSRKDYLSYEAPYLDYASEDSKDNREWETETARASIIGRINYDYASKYLFEFTMRADGSGEYSSEERWGYFPSVSAGWRISEEPFMKDNFSALNNLKLRASYGIMGNDAVSSFDYLTGYNISTSYYVFGSSSAPIINSAGLANPNITWETMKISNIGLDGTFWDGKLGFELDAFYRLRKDILAVPTENVPSTFGASLPKTNLNERDNRGFELTLTHFNKIGEFNYDISPMISWSRGKYVKLDEDVLPVTGDLDEETLEYNKAYNNRFVNEGQWDDRQWGYVSNGFFMNQQEIDEYAIDQDQAGNQTLLVGDIKYKDLNGDNYIDWRDQKVIGTSGLPNMMYSLDMGVQYKGFSLRMLWQGGADYTVSLSGSAAAPFSNESIPLEEHYDYRAIIANDGDGEYISNPNDFKLPPVTQNGRNSNNSKASDFWDYDTRYIRLKNLNFSYSLPQRLIENVGFKQCDIYFSGTNLITFDNLGIWNKSFDPEVPDANNRRYPPVKTLTFGIKLTL